MTDKRDPNGILGYQDTAMGQGDAPAQAPRAGAFAPTLAGARVVGSNDLAPLPAGDTLAETQPSRASRTSMPRIYADGAATTETREPVAPDAASTTQAIQIPYRSTDIVRKIGSYDVLAELGRGGMGVVYKAYSLRLCRMCALKVMIAGQHASAVEIVRFQNEAMLAARLQHPNIVAVFDAGEIDGQFFFVMEYVEGRSLTDLIQDNTEESLRIGLRAMAGVARALHYAHSKGIVHRDIKPDNILIDEQGQPHITDFGIAKSVEADANMTAAGALVGTPAYMSPEQMNGEIAAIGPLSDVYSAGATLYHLCAGRPPFMDSTPLALIAKALMDEPESPRDVARQGLQRDLPLDLETICLHAIEKKASDRYASAEALADDIEAHLEDRPISARPIGSAERLQKLIRRNRAAFVGAAVVFSTLLVVGLSFGIILAFNIQKTSDSLRSHDTRAAIDQAGTLATSIKVNMLQGRADVVRELVSGLCEDSKLSRVEVVRTDRTYAYTDLATRGQVAKRLADPDRFTRILEKWPALKNSLQEVQETAFVNIDANEKADSGLYDYERSAWNDLLKAAETVTRTERVGGEPMLTVLQPLENGEQCQACHGEVDDAAYGDNRIRAVLVVQRSQRDVEDRIEANKRATYLIGGITAGTIIVLIWLFARLFGVRLRKRKFAVHR